MNITLFELLCDQSHFMSSSVYNWLGENKWQPKVVYVQHRRYFTQCEQWQIQDLPDRGGWEGTPTPKVWVPTYSFAKVFLKTESNEKNGPRGVTRSRYTSSPSPSPSPTARIRQWWWWSTFVAVGTYPHQNFTLEKNLIRLNWTPRINFLYKSIT